MSRPPVKANRVDCFDDMKNPGDFVWSPWPPSRILAVCPCGCGDMFGAAVKAETGGGPVWQWDGNAEAPTLTPSLRRLDGCKWHGFLTAGEFREC